MAALDLLSEDEALDSLSEDEADAYLYGDAHLNADVDDADGVPGAGSSAGVRLLEELDAGFESLPETEDKHCA